MADTGTDDASRVATAPDPLWDDWDHPPRVPDAPELHLAGFDGPMDLLLDLAERQRVDLERISILQLAEQFIAEMDRLQQHVALERRAEWLVMAARLLLLRSRLLFPANPDVAAEAAREAGSELERLQRSVTLRAAGAWLTARPQLGQEVFARPQARHPRVASYMALMEACLAELRGRDGQPGAEELVYHPAPALLFRVDQAMARIRALVVQQPEGVDFVHCLPVVRKEHPQHELLARSAVASSFIAVLELARGAEVSASQTEMHTSILIKASC